MVSNQRTDVRTLGLEREGQEEPREAAGLLTLAPHDDGGQGRRVMRLKAPFGLLNGEKGNREGGIFSSPSATFPDATGERRPGAPLPRRVLGKVLSTLVPASPLRAVPRARHSLGSTNVLSPAWKEPTIPGWHSLPRGHLSIPSWPTAHQLFLLTHGSNGDPS